jgi:hypothetical protein
MNLHKSWQNAVTAEVGPGTQVSDFRTNQALSRISTCEQPPNFMEDERIASARCEDVPTLDVLVKSASSQFERLYCGTTGGGT